MATGQYIGVNGVARKVKTPYVGVSGVARTVKNGYVGVDGVARMFYESAVLVVPPGSTALKVKKITSNTYAGETAYTGEEFILLDIYPKTNGTVSVTYGGLTKTITDTSGAEEPNAQQVFFGTYNGVSDSKITPSSGTLIIQGDCLGFGVTNFQTGSKSTNTAYYSGILEVVDFGNVNIIQAYAFSNCTGLKSITIPDSVTSIGAYAFSNCTGLKSITIPSSVTSMGDYVFNNCTGLLDVVLSNGVTKIVGQEFSGCTNLTSVTIPAGLTNIYEGAFQNCHKLTNFIVDNGNPNYSSNGPILFNKNKTALYAYPSASGNYAIPSGITYIGDYAFYGTQLTNFTIPSSVTDMGQKVFASCNSLIDITLSGILTNANYYTTIAVSAFVNCTNLTTVIFPPGSTGVRRNMFMGCSKLENVILPSGVTAITNNAFENCTSLKSITLPETMSDIGARAFHLEEGNSRTVTMLSTTPPKLLADTVFDVIGTNNIIVPAGCGDVYKSASTYWSEYADYITEAS